MKAAKCGNGIADGLLSCSFGPSTIPLTPFFSFVKLLFSDSFNFALELDPLRACKVDLLEFCPFDEDEYLLIDIGVLTDLKFDIPDISELIDFGPRAFEIIVIVLFAD